jgi:hypothetical protein
MSDKEAPLGRIMLKNVRIAFPIVFTPKPFRNEKDGKPRYSCKLLIRNDDPQLAQLRLIMKRVAEDQWPTKKNKLETLTSQNKVCLHDGAKLAEDHEGFEGHHFLNCSSPGDKPPPKVLDADRTELTETSGKPYSGCYVNASVELWAQNNTYGERINCQLRGVQFFRDGDAFVGGRPARIDEFEDVTEATVEDFV